MTARGAQDLAAIYGGRRALVTGGLGFIGSQLARRLLALGAEVSLIDALVPGHGGNPFNVEDVRDRLAVTQADVCDRAAIEAAVAGQDYVFHLAGQVSHTDSMRDPASDLDHNCRASLSVLEACRRQNPTVRVAFAGTRQIYGRPQRLPMDESHPIRPVDVNGVHKWAAEQYHRLYHEVHGLPSVVLRLTNTYGPGQLVKHPRQGFIGWFVRKVVEGGEIEIMGDGSQLRDLNFVDDVADALLVAASAPAAWGQVYNLGAPEPVSLESLAQRLVAIAGRGSYRFVPFPPERKSIDIGSVRIDYGKIRRELGWEPRVGLRDGLTRTVRYYEQHLHHYVD
ncbi:MAG TPA: NAD-dependent epimerase/dehydratase family protein [Myxococcota bacterium]|nr:NAD-dependent epimerase/dehydratase family protein [Myxococcota bacterium]